MLESNLWVVMDLLRLTWHTSYSKGMKDLLGDVVWGVAILKGQIELVVLQNFHLISILSVLRHQRFC